MKNNKGFVVSAVLYPLLVLFLALIMGLLAMTDTRKRILDKMKLEISDSIFDEATCSCDTILNKLNYIIKNGVAGGGGGGGSYTYNVLGVNVKAYDAPASMPNVGNGIGDIAVITDVEIDSYYVSRTAPGSPKEGTVWIVQDKTSNYHITSDYSNIGISYVMQYINGKWELKKSYVYDNARWTLLYYVPLKDGIVDITGSDLNAEIVKTYSYTGEYQTFTARFSGYYQVELWGAQGGHTTYGGKGAYTKGMIYLDAGEILYFYVGQMGNTNGTGGWNGGGNSYIQQPSSGGGGSTDVRLVSTGDKKLWNDFDSLKSRIMVAAGGGGYNGYTTNTKGGSGGGLIGYDGTYTGTSFNYVPTGGTQSLGGLQGGDQIWGAPGNFGYGGRGNESSNHGGGGGSGYYGGGGGSNSNSSVSSGAGGSSYISGHIGCNSISEGSTINNIIHMGNPSHYSDFYFIDTVMIDGNGYNWTNKKEALISQPTIDGNGTQLGQSGNGYAKITLNTVEVIQEPIEGTKMVNEYNYTYANHYQILDVVKSGTYLVELWGAQGGQTTYGGKGAYTSGEIYLNAGEKYYIYVGSTPKLFELSIGGYNGGANSYTYTPTSGGGGATDLRIVNGNDWDYFESLKSRIMVAGGGGGYSGYSSNVYGGGGGGLTGNHGNYGGKDFNYVPTGGTQSYGGMRGGGGTIWGAEGSFGHGGEGNKSSNHGGGGGGGYYGGGGGSNFNSSVSSGAGGSSYVSGYVGVNSISEESTATNIMHTGKAYHYSNLYFNNPVMKDSVNTGDGKARVTFISEKEVHIPQKYEYHYSFSGNYQTFNAPQTGNYQVELWGAQGWNSTLDGRGAYTKGNIYLTKGTKLYVYVGSASFQNTPNIGGWNGGGTGYLTQPSGGGGGATDIRTIPGTLLISWNESKSLNSRIMVAAGGGAYNGYGSVTKGGAGGGLTGYNGTYGGTTVNQVPTGGSQIVGGKKGGGGVTWGTDGGFGYGGRGNESSKHGGGGGSGWYGGGGGSNYNSSVSSGAGGSSYISGHAGCIAINSNGNPLVQTYSKLSDSVSFTGYKFTDTKMVDGEGYTWETEKKTVSNMPSHDGTYSMTGNPGNGFAKITYLGA